VSDWLPEPPEVDPRPGPAAPQASLRNLLVALVCITVIGMCLAWAYLAMRAVMAVGGSCGSGGPYEVSTPCPDGSWLLAIGIPVMVVAALAGSGFAAEVGAPNQLIILWGVLFGSLGWNFFEFAFTDGFAFSLVVCGVIFWGMALPAWTGMGRTFVRLARTQPRALGWWAVYAVLLLCGGFLGVAVYAAAS